MTEPRLHTPAWDIFGREVRIMLAGMGWVDLSKLVAAVAWAPTPRFCYR